jgi:hypothetical protein
MPETGAPDGIDKGWAYAPGASVTDLVSSLAQKLGKHPAAIGAALNASIPGGLLAARREAFDQFVTETLAGPPRGAHFVLGAMRPEWIAKATSMGVTPATAEISVLDRNIWHTFRDTKVAALSLDWYRDLPLHLVSPDLVLLETGPHQAFLMFFSIPGGSSNKIVLRLNYRVKKLGILNVIETGRIVSDDDIRSMIGRGAAVIEGTM